MSRSDAFQLLAIFSPLLLWPVVAFALTFALPAPARSPAQAGGGTRCEAPRGHAAEPQRAQLCCASSEDAGADAPAQDKQ